MKYSVKDFIYSTRGKYVFSILLGIGLASLFRKACSTRNCLVFKAPSLNKIKDKIFSYNDKCYSFNTTSVTCNKENNQIIFDSPNSNEK